MSPPPLDPFPELRALLAEADALLAEADALFAGWSCPGNAVCLQSGRTAYVERRLLELARRLADLAEKADRGARLLPLLSWSTRNK